MTRATRAIGILCLGLVLFSCAVWDKLSGSAPEENETTEMSKAQLWDAYKRYEADNQLLRRQVAQLKKDAVKHKNEIQRLAGETADLKQANTALKEQNQALEEALARKEAVKPEPAPASPPEDTGKQRETLKVKVLSGDGKLRSANQLAGELRDMGYTIQLIHMAPTADFSRHTVFYAADFKKEGEELAARLGGRAVAKALTWPSVFDLIAVTGKTE